MFSDIFWKVFWDWVLCGYYKKYCGKDCRRLMKGNYPVTVSFSWVASSLTCLISDSVNMLTITIWQLFYNTGVFAAYGLCLGLWPEKGLGRCKKAFGLPPSVYTGFNAFQKICDANFVTYVIRVSNGPLDVYIFDCMNLNWNDLATQSVNPQLVVIPVPVDFGRFVRSIIQCDITLKVLYQPYLRLSHIIIYVYIYGYIL